jgi:hypothetical protein
MYHASAVSLPPGDVILAQLTFPLNDVIICLLMEELTNPFTNVDTYFIILNSISTIAFVCVIQSKLPQIVLIREALLKGKAQYS